MTPLNNLNWKTDKGNTMHIPVFRPLGSSHKWARIILPWQHKDHILRPYVIWKEIGWVQEQECVWQEAILQIMVSNPRGLRSNKKKTHKWRNQKFTQSI